MTTEKPYSRVMLWYRAIQFLISLVATGVIVWYTGDQHSFLHLPFVARVVISIAFEASMVYMFSKLGWFSGQMRKPLILDPFLLGIAASMGGCFATCFAPGFFTVEPYADSGLICCGLAAVGYYAFAVREYPRTAGQINMGLYMPLIAIGAAAFLIWLNHVDPHRHNHGGLVRFTLVTVLWQSLRTVHKYITDHKMPPPAPAGLEAVRL